MAFNQPLELEFWIVNTLTDATPTLFYMIAFMFIAGACAYFRMSNYVALMMFVLFGVLFSSILGGVWVLILLITGMVTFYSISKLMKR